MDDGEEGEEVWDEGELGLELDVGDSAAVVEIFSAFAAERCFFASGIPGFCGSGVPEDSAGAA